jgi:flavin-dependent thymidylate synthase
MEITTDRTIARQILRHRSFSFQEFSQRYAEVPDFVEPYAPRLQDTKNRQNSIEIDDPELAGWWIGKQDVLIEQARSKYQWALEKGIAKEVARVVLPEGLTQSRLYMAGTLRSWIHYCQLRMGNGTQKEHKLIAEQCWNVLCEQFPAITDLFKVDPLEQAVEDFAAALLKRLRLRTEQGKSGWEEDDWEGDCLYKMYRSAEQGDALDTAGYALFAHYHGWGKTDAD